MRHAPFGDWTYLSIVTSVKDFDCAAIPVTAELIDAFEKAGVDPFDQFGLSKNDLLPSNTTFTLSLNLFETDENGEETGKRWILGDIETFTYKPLKVLPSVPTLPQTGDNSTPLLWMALVVLSASAVLMMRRKAYNR